MIHYANTNQEKTGVAVLIAGAHNHRAGNYMKPKLTELQREINKSKIIVSNFNNSLSIINGTSRKKISKHVENQLDIIDIVVCSGL